MTDAVEAHAIDLQKVFQAHDTYVEGEYNKIVKYVAAVRKDLQAKSLVVNKRVRGFLDIIARTTKDKTWLEYEEAFVPEDPLELLADAVDDAEAHAPDTTEDASEGLDAAMRDYRNEGEEEDDEDDEDAGEDADAP